jgi:exodeoxyribonuclease VII small subunit
VSKSAENAGEKESELALEPALARIEALVAEMENGDLPLETMISRFEEGAKLVKACQEKLDACEKKIKVIAKQATGSSTLEEFGDEA